MLPTAAVRDITYRLINARRHFSSRKGIFSTFLLTYSLYNLSKPLLLVVLHLYFLGELKLMRCARALVHSVFTLTKFRSRKHIK